MNNPISIVGKWHYRGEGYETVLNFGSDGDVTWDGQANGKSFRCKGVYQLDEAVTPAVLQVTDVEILQIDAADDGKTPIAEEGLVLRFYQAFDGEAGMRLEGMAVKPENEPSRRKISDGPGTMILSRL